MTIYCSIVSGFNFLVLGYKTETNFRSVQAPSSASSAITSASLEAIFTAITSTAVVARVERQVDSTLNLGFYSAPMR